MNGKTLFVVVTPGGFFLASAFWSAVAMLCGFVALTGIKGHEHPAVILAALPAMGSLWLAGRCLSNGCKLLFAQLRIFYGRW